MLNVLLLPLAALTPALAKYRDYGYGRLFPPGVCTGGYLLQTAFFQAHAPAVHERTTQQPPA